MSLLTKMPFIMGCMIAVTLCINVGTQTTSDSVQRVLEERIQPSAVTASQLQSYLAKRILKLSPPTTAEKWSAEAASIRNHALQDVAFHGWSRDWIDAAPRFQETEVIESAQGYRLRKFRYEIVPGFESTAILYEPQKLNGKAPAILNLLGHEVAGNAAEYEQKRCINFVKRGIVALSLSWVGFGELAQPENGHDYAAHLDLVGANALGFFYLSMRRGLDYLASLPQVDTRRLGVTGLSGGGWQTTLLSALDERVAVAVEVAGIGALQSNLIRPLDTDEIEENATDLAKDEDYPLFLAIRAPRPTLLIHNAEDDCCFRSALVKPYIYDQVRPYFRLLGREDELAWYENRDPGTHNYQLANREQAYAFFTKNLGLPVTPNEIRSDNEIRAPEQLAAGLPQQNLTIVGLARRLAGHIVKTAVPTGNDRGLWIQSQRQQLRNVIRYAPVSIENAWRTNNTKHLGLETLSYRFDFSNQLSATGVWLQAISASSHGPTTIVLADQGYKAAGEVVSEHVNRGEPVLALDLLFNGATAPENPADWEMLVATTGDRPLGLEVAQLLAVAAWLESNNGHHAISVVTKGIRNQVIALTSAALDPDAFAGIESRQSMGSLDYLLRNAVPFRSAPELFCLDLYKYFDLDLLSLVAAPTEVKRIGGEAAFEKGTDKRYE
ncbi:MAG TPA: acetylxylan esterase [Terriglobales bacterium]|nr:acetylxylan esterase [Terriglobales bacterium]